MSEDNKQVLKPVKIVKVKVKKPEVKTEASTAVVQKQIKKTQAEELKPLPKMEEVKPVPKPQPTKQPMAVSHTRLFEEPAAPPARTRVDVKQTIQGDRRKPVPVKVPVYNRWWYWFTIAAVILGVVALAKYNGFLPSSNQDSGSSADVSVTTVADTEDSNAGVSVDENLLTVEVTMPATFFENETPEEIQASAKENGFLSCTINEDGSVTYKMTKGKRAEILRSFKGEIDSTIQEYLAGGEDAPQSYRKITYNDKVTQFDVRVDRAAYENSWTDAFYMMGFYFLGGYYQIIDGVPSDQVDVIVNIIDDATGENIETGSYKNFINNQSTQ